MKIKYKVRVNRAGVIFIGITVFLGVAAVNTANNLLYLVVSYMLSFMLLSGVLSLYNLKGIDVVIIPPEEAYVGQRTTLRAVLKNNKSLPSFLIALKVNGKRYIFPLLPSGEEVEGTIDVAFERRGMYSSIGLEVSSSFPVGLFERFYILHVPLNLVLFPRPIFVEENLLRGLAQELGSVEPQDKRQGYEDLYGIREYSNDPLKLVHWKLSAKTGNLYVKEMLEESAPPVILSPDMVEGSLEERISKLTYLVIKLISEGRAVGLQLPDKIIEPSTGKSHKRRLLTELALL